MLCSSVHLLSILLSHLSAILENSGPVPRSRFNILAMSDQTTNLFSPENMAEWDAIVANMPSANPDMELTTPEALSIFSNEDIIMMHGGWDALRSLQTDKQMPDIPSEIMDSWVRDPLNASDPLEYAVPLYTPGPSSSLIRTREAAFTDDNDERDVIRATSHSAKRSCAAPQEHGESLLSPADNGADGFAGDSNFDCGLSSNPRQVYDNHTNILKDFSTKNVTFKYSPNGVLQDDYTGDQLKEFIYERPSERLLTVWIRRTPYGVGDRFSNGVNTSGSPQCMCSQCPLKRLERMSIPYSFIPRGEYIVAFDELEHLRPDKNIDPYAISGYIHFYCLEHFVGLQQLTLHIGGSEDNFHVPLVFDDRKTIETEPKGNWPCALSPNDMQLLNRWKDICISNGGDQDPSYPTAREFLYPGGAHNRSLLKFLHERQFADKRTGDKNSATSGGNEGTHKHVHKGNLEVIVAAQMQLRGAWGEMTYAQRALLVEARKPWIDAEHKRQADAKAQADAKSAAEKKAAD